MLHRNQRSRVTVGLSAADPRHALWPGRRVVQAPASQVRRTLERACAVAAALLAQTPTASSVACWSFDALLSYPLLPRRRRVMHNCYRGDAV